MANTVFQIKRSSVPGKVPQSADLSVGELAINLADQLLYSKDSTGTVFAVSSAANVSSFSISSFFPTGNYGLVTDQTTSAFGESLLASYDMSQTLYHTSLITVDLGSSSSI